MKTFLAWAIANLEIFGVILLLPFTWIFLVHHPDLRLSDSSMWGSVFFLSFLVLVAGGAPWGNKGTFTDFFSILLTIFGAFIMMFYANGMTILPWTHLCIAGAVGLAAGTVIAVYAVNNFYEVVSLRWLFANSNATKFQESALYGISRFAVGFHIGVFVYTLLL